VVNNSKNKKRKPDYIVFFVSIMLIIGVLVFITNTLNRPIDVSSEKLETLVKDNEIESFSMTVTKDPNYYIIKGKLTDAGKNNTLGHSNHNYTALISFDDANRILELAKNSKTINVELKTPSGFDAFSFILGITPLLLGVAFIFILLKNASGGNNKAFEFGKNRARLYKTNSVTFKDVAGLIEEKEELHEVVDFLKNPKKYNEIGARIPKGVLLVGSPGTGKTLLAKAVAGEALVPFFSISGSDFVEMFVGVGASRVRDLFKNAKANAPCIIFIDEIDAVGRQRGAGLGGGHDEREQTLNQLLVEMDGFSPNQGIIIIAASNRPDVLDPALLRPGRFDRQIMIDLPDLKGRSAILKVHSRNKKLDESIDFKNLAARIPGFSGADIENLLNEAALLAARSNRGTIIEKDLDEAMDRVRMGPAKKSRKYSDEEKKIIAYHEAGHAVIGIKLEHANVVQKVTIIPRGRAGGYNLMMPTEERFLHTKKSLLETITGYLGGRVAEEIEFDSITTGAHNDFEMATKIARSMVTEYGMSSLGPIQYENRGKNVFLGRDYLNEKNFSDKVAHEIDNEVKNIIDGCFQQARIIIKENRTLLDSIAYYLMKVETLTKSDIDEIVETGKLSSYDDEVNKNSAPIINAN